MPKMKTAQDVVCRALGRDVAEVLRHDVALRGMPSPEAVHDARVAVRRLRSDLRAFEPVLERAWSRGLRERLRWLGDALGAARNADVLVARLRADAEQLPAADRAAADAILDDVRAGRRDAYARLAAVTAGEVYAALLRDLERAGREPWWNGHAATRARRVAGRVMKRTWKRLRRAVRRSADPPTDDELHRIRIEAKHARYAAEALQPAAGRAARRFARRVERLQTILGDQHDAAISRDYVRVQAATGDSAFAAGEIARLESAAADHGRGAWLDAWRAAKRRPRFWR